MNTDLIRTFIETRRQPLSAAVETATRLDVLCDAAPEFCVKALGDAQTHVSQKAQLLAGLVRSSIERHQIVDRLRTLTDAELLHVLDGLRVRRLNGRRVRALGLAALVGHSRFAELAANHRLRLVRIFKHLLGERTWSSVRRHLEITSDEGDRFLRASVLRFADDVDAAREAICFLAGFGFDEPVPVQRPWFVVPWLRKPERPKFAFTDPNLRQSAAARQDLVAGRGMSRETLSGIRGTYHRDVSSRTVRDLAATPAALTVSAKAGYPEAQYNLAALYQHGWGVEIDRDAAHFWYAEAARRGQVEVVPLPYAETIGANQTHLMCRFRRGSRTDVGRLRVRIARPGVRDNVFPRRWTTRRRRSNHIATTRRCCQRRSPRIAR